MSKTLSDKTLTKEKITLLKNAGYSKKIIQLYTNQVNVGTMRRPNVSLSYTGSCGDSIKLYLKIVDDIIEDATFHYIGCPASAACGSIITQLVKKKKIKDALKITKDDVLKELNGLPNEECHCAKLAVTTLQKTLKKYENKKKKL